MCPGPLNILGDVCVSIVTYAFKGSLLNEHRDVCPFMRMSMQTHKDFTYPKTITERVLLNIPVACKKVPTRHFVPHARDRMRGERPRIQHE